MKQRELWEGHAIVRDPVVIKEYLARLMRILAGNPHNQGEVK